MEVNTVKLLSPPDTVCFSQKACILHAASRNHVSIVDFDKSGGMEFPKANTACAYSQESKTLAMGQSNGLLLFYDVETGKLRDTFGGKTPLSVIKFSPNGRFLAGANGEATFLVDLEAGKTIHKFHGDFWPYGQFNFSPNGRYFTKANLSSRTIRMSQMSVDVYDLQEKKIVHTTPIEGTITQIKFTPDSKRIVVSTTDPGRFAYATFLRCFDVATGKVLFQWESDESVSDVSFTSDCKIMAVGTRAGALVQDGVVRLLDMENGAELVKFECKNPVFDVEISHDDRLLSVVSGDKARWGADETELSIYDMNKSRIVYTFESGEFYTMSSFSADGRFLVTGGRGATVRLFEFEKDASLEAASSESGVSGD